MCARVCVAGAVADNASRALALTTPLLFLHGPSEDVGIAHPPGEQVTLALTLTLSVVSGDDQAAVGRDLVYGGSV